MTTVPMPLPSGHSRSRRPRRPDVLGGDRAPYVGCAALAVIAALAAGLTVAFPSLLRGVAVSNGNLRGIAVALLAGGLLRSEWTKLRSLRSTVWSLVMLVVVTVGFTALFTALTVAQWATIAPATKAQVLADPGRMVLGAGFQLGQLAVCVLGVIVMTGEYSSGTIRASLLAVPTRTPMLAAKAAVFALLIAVVGELTAVPTFFLGAAILHSHAPVSITDPGVLRAVVGAGLYLAVLAVFAIAIGALVRHTAGAITGIVGFVLVLSPLTQLLPGRVGRYIHGYLPSEVGSLIASPRHGADDVLGPWQGFGVFCLQTAVLIGAAAYLLRRRDA